MKAEQISRKPRQAKHQAAGDKGGAVATMPGGPLSITSQRLLQIAENVSRRTVAAGPSSECLAPLSEFVQIYREWIATNRGNLEPQQLQAEQWQMIMYTMVAAPTIEEAIHHLMRFGKVVWGERRPTELRREGDHVVLIFAEPYRAGPEGLIAVIWLLALTLCELEFLANVHFSDVSGRVLHDPCLSEGVVRLLFAPPIAFSTNEVALSIPAHYLRRPVTARAADLPRFFGELLPLTLGAHRQSPAIRTMAAGLMRDDKLGPEFRAPTLQNVAARLGMSTATLRRRLRDEGTSYRSVRDEVYNGLAREWLSQPDISIEAMANRLDYSDGFAFRRFFRRLNGVSPSAHRQALPG